MTSSSILKILASVKLTLNTQHFRHISRIKPPDVEITAEHFFHVLPRCSFARLLAFYVFCTSTSLSLQVVNRTCVCQNALHLIDEHY